MTGSVFLDFSLFLGLILLGCSVVAGWSLWAERQASRRWAKLAHPCGGRYNLESEQ